MLPIALHDVDRDVDRSLQLLNDAFPKGIHLLHCRSGVLPKGVHFLRGLSAGLPECAHLLHGFSIPPTPSRKA